MHKYDYQVLHLMSEYFLAEGCLIQIEHFGELQWIGKRSYHNISTNTGTWQQGETDLE